MFSSRGSRKSGKRQGTVGWPWGGWLGRHLMVTQARDTHGADCQAPSLSVSRVTLQGVARRLRKGRQVRASVAGGSGKDVLSTMRGLPSCDSGGTGSHWGLSALRWTALARRKRQRIPHPRPSSGSQELSLGVQGHVPHGVPDSHRESSREVQG